MKKLFVFVIFLTQTYVQAQLNETFSDSNFLQNPIWYGDVVNWKVNNQLQLQSNSVLANANFSICTASSQATNLVWSFFCNLQFNPSSANYVDVFLVASDSNFLGGSTTGYFLRLGSATDDICLYRKEANQVLKLIDGADGLLNKGSNSFRIKVVRNTLSEWSLFYYDEDAGVQYQLVGQAVDTQFNQSSFFGIQVKQSTGSFFQKHFFDDFLIEPFVPDSIPPKPLLAVALNATDLAIEFTEPLNKDDAENPAHYLLNGIYFPVIVKLDSFSSVKLTLHFRDSFPERILQSIMLNGIKDLQGNILQNGQVTFNYIVPHIHDVLFNEIMADPSPMVGLPDAEWIELFNPSGFDINLSGWRIGKPDNLSSYFPDLLLKADSFLIICNTSSYSEIKHLGKTIAVAGFPALSNAGDLISLIDRRGKLIHAIQYSDAWYRNDIKKNGGWTLEQIDPKNPCSSVSNWKASESLNGGSPGIINSVSNSNGDTLSPHCLQAFAIDSLTIELRFSEGIDSLDFVQRVKIKLSNGVGSPVSIKPVPPLFVSVILTFNAQLPLQRKTIYQLSIEGYKDCSGNSANGKQTLLTGIPETASKQDLIINEILFNPTSGGYDFIECYHKGTHPINLKHVYIAHRNEMGSIVDIEQVSGDDQLLYPGNYCVFTENIPSLMQQYIVPNPESILEINRMPSMPDDEGTIMILNERTEILDEVSYDKDWHFKLINKDEGVSLERVWFDHATQDAQNWHSAASAVGFATPTYKNSQSGIDEISSAAILVSPKTISPDNDGHDDYATISYDFPDIGYVCNIRLYDVAGRPVRNLQEQALCGKTGRFIWDGLDSKQQRLPSGIYIIATEAFNLSGKTKRFKQVVVISQKNN